MGRTEPELAKTFSCHTQLQLAMVLRPQWKQMLSKFSNLLSRQFAEHHHFNWKLTTCQTNTLDTSKLHCRVCRLALFSMLASLARNASKHCEEFKLALKGVQSQSWQIPILVTLNCNWQWFWDPNENKYSQNSVPYFRVYNTPLFTKIFPLDIKGGVIHG